MTPRDAACGLQVQGDDMLDTHNGATVEVGKVTPHNAARYCRVAEHQGG